MSQYLQHMSKKKKKNVLAQVFMLMAEQQDFGMTCNQWRKMPGVPLV